MMSQEVRVPVSPAAEPRRQPSGMSRRFYRIAGLVLVVLVIILIVLFFLPH